MTPDEIKALRASLKCTAKELAATLAHAGGPGPRPQTDVDQALVIAWEKGELFPTKHFVDAMEALRAKGPTAIVRKAKGAAASPMAAMKDALLWELFRKLAAHKKLRDDVAKLAEKYPDPADEA